MATAPTPGRAARKDAQRQAIKITIGDETRILYMADLGPNDDMVARKETTMPVSSFVGEDVFALDSVAILWWMAARKSGQPKLKFRTVLYDFPSYAELNDLAEDGRFSVESIDSDDDEEGADHPLPSAADS